MNTETLDYSQINLYNTQRVSDEQSRLLFVARTKLLNLLLKQIRSTRRNAPPTHQLIIGQRGMGKTSLLKRIEVELRTQSEYKDFIPLLFPEEQYNVDSLATFWLNCLDTLADLMEAEGHTEDVIEIDKEVERLSSLSADEKTKKASDYFKHIVFNLKRRPVLLVDNINIVLERLKTEEQHILRSYLTEEGAAIIIGASSVQIDQVHTYEAPFYDAFQLHYLRRLSGQELKEILNNLAKVTGQSGLKKAIKKNSSRLKAINQLTGGNPRTAVILFKQIIEGFSDDITKELDGILDAQTPLYKARFEELPEKMQIIVNAIAMQWDPVSLEQIREATQMENGQISPQLKRLCDFGWIEKPKTARGKGGSYEISERMFNIWFLMRLSSRRQKKKVTCLSKFMEAFYEKGEDISELLNRMMVKGITEEDHAVTILALAKLTEDRDIRWKLHEKTRNYIIQHPETNESFEQKDLYDGADEQANAFIEAVNKDDAAAIVYNGMPIYQDGHEDIANLLALALIKIKEFQKAYEVIASIPEGKEKYGLLIDLAISVHDEAHEQINLLETCCKDALNSKCNDSKAYFYYGLFLIENARYDEAVNFLIKAQELFPNDDRIFLPLAQGYYFTNRLKESEALLESILNKGKDVLWDVYFLLSIIRFRQGRYSDAETLLYQTKKLIDNVSLIDCWLIATLANEGKQEEATSHLEHVKDTLDNPGYLASLIADPMIKEGNFDSIILYMEQLSKYWPENTTIQFVQAQAYYFQESYTEALRLLDPYLKAHPNDATALMLRGTIAWQAGDDIEQALDWLMRAAKAEESAQIYDMAGYIEQLNSRYTEAANLFEKALSIDPNDSFSLSSLASLYEFKLGNPNLAVTYLNRKNALEPHNDAYRLVNLYRDSLSDLSLADETLRLIPTEDRSDHWESIHHILSTLRKKDKQEAGKGLLAFYSQYDIGNLEREKLCYLYAKFIEFGEGDLLVNMMEKAGVNEHSAPEYYAVKAILSNDIQAYFDTVAKEIREVGISIAKDIMFYIRKTD